ncbi:unnamed protein product [Acanthoscelides obtectus]|uniref:E3 ubiquitin-protein ligase RNF10 n=2 Tax=Acanthoscelides obtectus TaxID=200917 RepID=A0A9P0KSB4_ACAOB|nr:unnamed protein product [Acanthoscelides obtectus]CAK1633095.1 RING finger protein 10 [Acanthoscelides obtectus]
MTTSRETSHHHNLHRTKKHRYNKEHFLQANCQFVVNDKGNYKRYMNDPDALVDWSFVEQINVQVSDFPSCPICLYPPTAAKMTRCGHIYCWSCILHYLSLSDKQWRKCPICYESVCNEDLKSVVAIPYSLANVSDSITLKLMKRPKGSLIAYPCDTPIKDEDAIFEISERDAADIYSKLLLARKKDVLAIIERESKELDRQIKEDQDCPERCFVEQAITLLKEREDQVLEGQKGDTQNAETTNITEIDQESDKETTTTYENVDMTNMRTVTEEEIFGAACNDTFDQTTNPNENIILEALGKAVNNLDINSVVDEINDKQSICTNVINQPSKYHYFYQSSDGQHIYLHAINARMLEHTYGSLENAPKTITGRILEKEGGSMTDDLRRRLRYLQHLPVTCQFEIAEIELRKPIVSQDTLDAFKDQLEQRRHRRQRRAKEERRREKRIELETNRIIGLPRPAKPIQLESDVQFPRFEDAMSRIEAENATRERSESESTHLSEESSNGGWGVGSLERAASFAGPSFATMLANAKDPPQSSSTSRPNCWPIKKARTTADVGRFICAAGSKTMAVPSKASTPSDDGDTEWFQRPPVFRESFGNAVAQALTVKADNAEDDFQCAGKKKKKSKQKLLFTTNINYMN